MGLEGNETSAFANETFLPTHHTYGIGAYFEELTSEPAFWLMVSVSSLYAGTNLVPFATCRLRSCYTGIGIIKTSVEADKWQRYGWNTNFVGILLSEVFCIIMPEVGEFL